MDVIQIFGDYSKLLGMFILLMKIVLSKNCYGISMKTQIIYIILSLARYAELACFCQSVYLTIMELIFIILPTVTLAAMFYYKKSYESDYDKFRIIPLIVPCAILALFMNRPNLVVNEEKLWAFSQFLESVAILPQVYLLTKKKKVESIIVSYICALGLSRGFYLLHWIYQVITTDNESNGIAVSASIVQVYFYMDFFAKNLPTFKSKYANSHNGVEAKNSNEKKIEISQIK